MTVSGPMPYPLAPGDSESFAECRPRFLSGEDTPRDYLERRLARLALLEPQLRAFVHVDLAGARTAADASSARYRAAAPLSMLDGMPIGVKDIIETRDMPTQMGSPIYAGFQPRRDAACVTTLRQAGAVIVGKTVTTEFAAGRAGPTCNPFDPRRTPGGSSSGSAAAVGAGLLPAALGTQTMASIVRPASYCGAYGWKPTHGALSTDGVQPLSPTLDHLGVIAGSAEDAWAVGTVLGAAVAGSLLTAEGAAAPVPSRPQRLICLRTAGWPEADEPSRAALDRALRTLAAEGVEVLDVADPRVAAVDDWVVQAAASAWRVFAWESQWPLRSYRACGEHLVGPRLMDLMNVAASMTAADHRELLAWRVAYRAAVQALATPGTAFVSLASSGPAPLGLEGTGSRQFAAAWTLLGGPSFSLPVLRASGLPLGLQLMAMPGEDASATAMARWIMQRLSPSD
ncbi:MAG: amidase [Burkholderiaceae bacterium]|nr:amidase [Burkholderiaceae bacterium]MDO9090136.1 amidase [Burkholderiaceae bacterium]